MCAFFLGPPALMLVWWTSGLALHFGGHTPINFHGVFYFMVYACAFVGGLAWPVLGRRYLHFVAFKPLLLPLVHGALAVFFVATISYGLIPIFLGSGDGARVALRLLALPLVAEVSAAGLRISDRYMLEGNVPGAIRGFRLLAVSLTLAITGRFFVTGLQTTGLTIALSIAVAAIEVTMRWTMLSRDQLFKACGVRLRRWASTCPGCSCIQSTDSGKKLPTMCSRLQCRPSDELLSSRRRWADLSPAEQTARDTRANYAFIVGDTVSEDIGMLTLIPVAIFFRLPTRIGGEPLPLGDVLLRVGFQWLLELATDVGPFVAYAAGRAWLTWRGDKLYGGVTRAEIGQALASMHPAQGTVMPADTLRSDGEAPVQSSPVPSHKSTHGAAKAAPSVIVSSGATSIDDSEANPLASTSSGAVSPAASGAALVYSGTGSGRSVVGAAGTAVISSDGASPATASSAHPHDSAYVKQRVEWRRSLLCCAVQPDDVTACAHIRLAQSALLLDDGDVLWQELPWPVVRAAMAPGAAPEQWGWLHWFVFRNELLATRVATAWERRPVGWNATVLLMCFLFGGMMLRGYLDTNVVCSFVDRGGQRYWDACVE